MVELRKYHITAEIDAPDFEAETKDEAKELFWESISDRYGVASCVQHFTIEEQH